MTMFFPSGSSWCVVFARLPMVYNILAASHLSTCPANCAAVLQFLAGEAPPDWGRQGGRVRREAEAAALDLGPFVGRA